MSGAISSYPQKKGCRVLRKDTGSMILAGTHNLQLAHPSRWPECGKRAFRGIGYQGLKESRLPGGSGFLGHIPYRLSLNLGLLVVYLLLVHWALA